MEQLSQMADYTPPESGDFWKNINDDVLERNVSEGKLSPEKFEEIKKKKRIRERAHEAYEEKMKEFEKKIATFAKKVGDTELPQEVKERLQLLIKAIKSREYKKEELDPLLKELEEAITEFLLEKGVAFDLDG